MVWYETIKCWKKIGNWNDDRAKQASKSNLKETVQDTVNVLIF